MASKTLTVIARDRGVATKVANAIMDFVGHIPSSKKRKSKKPEADARNVANYAAAEAAFTAGTLALPPGPLGWLTILPEMVAVWKLQAQMVADIAALYGKKVTLTKGQMIYCLFRHTAAQEVKDLVVRISDQFLVRRASVRLLQSLAQRIGVKITQRAIGKGLSRWLPVVGALGVGAYAYYDTAQVARTAIELFSTDIEIEPAGPEPHA